MIITIVAIDNKNGIGKDGSIPWYISDDLKFFKSMSLTQYSVNNDKKPNILIMGRKTWESTNYYMFPNREVIIISKSHKFNKPLPPNFCSAISCDSISILSLSKNRDVIIIGGETIYDYFWKFSHIIFLTKIYKNYNCDRFFPKFPTDNLNLFKLVKKSDMKFDENENTYYQFTEYHNVDILQTNNPYLCTHLNISNNNSEKKYLDLLKHVLENGKLRKTRNAETISYFGTQLEFDISNTFPLLTTKRVFWKGVIEELIWFIKGNTDNTELKDKGVHIWDGNSTTEFLKKYGHPYEENICGPIYGWQWRRFNEKYYYTNRETHDVNNTKGEENGFDQLNEIIRLIKEDPHSRRIFMSGWNPNQLEHMVLPPCHTSYQFYVEDDKLSCHMYQRSGDLFLGVPFNIASTSALTYILAKMTDKKPDRVIISFGDVHIYDSHIDAVKKQIERTPYSYPVLNIKEKREKIEDYTSDDFEIIGYDCHPAIKAEMIA